MEVIECVHCKNGRCIPSTDTHEASFQNYLFRAELPALECQNCQEKSFKLDTLEQFELSVAQKLLREEDFSGALLSLVRRCLGLNREEIAKHFEPYQLIGMLEGDRMYTSLPTGMFIGSVREKLLDLVNEKIVLDLEVEKVK